VKEKKRWFRLSQHAARMLEAVERHREFERKWIALKTETMGKTEFFKVILRIFKFIIINEKENV
jgi:hypothetical protein